MTTKFIIAKAQVNGRWCYYNGPTTNQDNYIVDQINDAFIEGCIKKAHQFDKYEDAESRIKDFMDCVLTTKENNKIVKTYPGVGIYKIDKIFIHELPHTYTT